MLCLQCDSKVALLSCKIDTVGHNKDKESRTRHPPTSDDSTSLWSSLGIVLECWSRKQTNCMSRNKCFLRWRKLWSFLNLLHSDLPECIKTQGSLLKQSMSRSYPHLKIQDKECNKVNIHPLFDQLTMSSQTFHCWMWFKATDGRYWKTVLGCVGQPNRVRTCRSLIAA